MRPHLLRHTGSGRLIAAGCESTDVATDKALAGEALMELIDIAIGFILVVLFTMLEIITYVG